MKNKKNYISNSFYTQQYTNENWNNQLRQEAKLLLARLKLSQLRIKKDWVTLDAGCGSGELASLIKETYGSNVYGADINKEAIKQATKSGIQAQSIDLEEKWPYKNDTFDLVTATEIIEHVVNPDFFLKEIKRVLKKDGYVVITTPNLAAWFNRIIFLFGFQPFFLEVSTLDKTMGLGFTRHITSNREPVGHIRCFTLKAIRDILELHNFRVVFVKGTKGYYFPQPIDYIDGILSNITSISTNLTIIAQKKK